MGTPVNSTKILSFPDLDRLLSAEVFLASELGQRTGSFKFRAAWNLVQNVAAPRFIAASSGNFGQALACAAQLQGRGCTVVMPTNSARVKIDAVRSYGATVELVDVSVKSRAERVGELSSVDPGAYVASAYDCPWVIGGNASLGRELAAIGLDLDMIVAPVGGGGLSSGIVTGLCGAEDSTPVWGSEPLVANDAARSLRAGRLLRNESEPQTIADGARTVSLGRRNWDILSQAMPGIFEVTEEAIRKSMRILAGLGLRVEPTGAVSLASALEQPESFKGRRCCFVLSGGNVDPGLYKQLIGG
jgi:threonine dehydratase